jgi:SAM-dependent methyltransferase
MTATGLAMTKFDQRYGSDSFFYGTEPNTFLAAFVDRLPAGGEVLSLGEGEGRNAVYLAERGFRVHALDESAVGLAKAHRLAATRGVSITTECVDLANYVFEPARWDAIISIWCHVPSPLRARVHAGVVRSLRPGGVYLLEAYTPAQIGRGTGGPSDPDLMPTADLLAAEVRGLQPLHVLETEREVSEGTGHRGHSAVVQWVGMRAEGVL